jgi:hypothetical protein
MAVVRRRCQRGRTLVATLRYAQLLARCPVAALPPEADRLLAALDIV